MVKGNIWVIETITTQPVCPVPIGSASFKYCFPLYESLLITFLLSATAPHFHTSTHKIMFSVSSFVPQWILSSAENGERSSKWLLHQPGHGEKERRELLMWSHLWGQNWGPNFVPSHRRYANTDTILTWVLFLILIIYLCSYFLSFSVFVCHLLCGNYPCWRVGRLCYLVSGYVLIMALLCCCKPSSFTGYVLFYMY